MSVGKKIEKYLMIILKYFILCFGAFIAVEIGRAHV